LLFGYVGTPTSKEAIPVAEKAGIPYIAAFTGAELLRTPFRRYVVNFRASYYQETEKIVEHLVTDLGIKKIAVFRQDDSYGEAGRDGVIKALEKRKLQLTAEGKYKRNTIQIQEGFNSIDSTSPEAVVMVGAYKPCAEFMKKVKAEKKNWKIINISFVGASALAALAGDSAENTIVSQVVPSPWNDSIPIVAEYQKNLKKFEKNAEFDFISLESYAAAKMLTKVISSIEKPITSEKFIAAAEKLSKFEIDGLPLSLSPSNHQASNQVYFTKISDKKFIQINDFKSLK
jgi:branched-chain amino acid transport system substrate-binding protein